MKQNTEVYLPWALELEAEAGLEVLRQQWTQCYTGFTKENSNKKKEQKSNLTKDEKEGLESLRKRVAEREIIIVTTDKSGRFSIMDIETYMMAGLKHNKKDEVTKIKHL